MAMYDFIILCLWIWSICMVLLRTELKQKLKHNNMEKEEKYLAALKSVLGQHIYRPWMENPFHAGDRTVSSNGHMIISVPKFGDYDDHYKKVSSYLALQKNMDLVINISDIKKIIDQIPLVAGTLISPCECCNGGGEVEYEFYYGRKRYTEDLPCPVCDGQGEVETKGEEKTIDFSKQIRIGNSTFNVSRILELIQIYDILDEKSITLVRQIAPEMASVFKIGDADVIVMPAIELNRNDTYVLNI